ncbi:MAG: YbaY family lipoprotein [Alphaproteobacteria bacterium]|jgi:putative lipoprotein|nr:YbaY family lipoprotein [Alphaproteobacteria bacterium]MBU2192902.1 YbaY family lipoprotein [Alphaproteobacteria bacterium]
MHAIAELLIFGLAPLLFGGLVMPQPVSAEEKTIVGEVTYDERMAPPPGAVLTVRLTGLAGADEAETVVAQQTIRDFGEVSAGFAVTFDPATLQPGARYRLHAEVSVDGRVLLSEDLSDPAELHGTGPLRLKLVRAQA